MEISDLIKLSDDFWLKMPFDKSSAAMSLQVGFKGVGFFAVIKCNRIFDTLRFEFGCVRNIAFIVFL